MITVSRKHGHKPNVSGVFLDVDRAGKAVSLEDLERGVVISSGNDASVVESIRGQNRVVDVMNQIAADLGLDNTTYRNPWLPHPEHRTTARDLAKLGCPD